MAECELSQDIYLLFIVIVFFDRMRNYKRKTTRGSISQEVFELAAKEVLEKNRKYRDVATEYDICHVTLFKYVKKKRDGISIEVGYKKTD